MKQKVHILRNYALHRFLSYIHLLYNLMPERYKMIYLLVRLYQILAELIEYEVQKVIYLYYLLQNKNI